MKKTDETLVGYLTRDELQALLDAPDPLGRAPGVRDRAMLHLAFAAGLRVSELVNLRLDQIDRPTLSHHPRVGKGTARRDVLPLWKETAATLKAWLAVRPQSGDPELFLNAVCRAMTRSGFKYILAKHVATATRKQPSIGKKRVTPHILSHTCAMHTLQATRDIERSPVAWSCQPPKHRDLPPGGPDGKAGALAAASAPMFKPGRFRAPDSLLAMLNSVSQSKNYVE